MPPTLAHSLCLCFRFRPYFMFNMNFANSLISISPLSSSSTCRIIWLSRVEFQEI